jgi:hypothetical protein
MKEDRAAEDTPRSPARTALFRWITRPWARAVDAVGSKVTLFSFEPDDETDAEAELWMILLASDPDGTWYPWPGEVRRPHFDQPDLYHY